MVKRLDGSKFGEGTGGSVSSTDDPDNPSFDPATHKSQTDKKIMFLLEPHTIDRLTSWERQFVMSVYGQSPLTRKQHITVAGIYKRHTQPVSQQQ